MARTPLTLAALATAAVPGLDVIGASRLGVEGAGSFDQAVLQTRDRGSVLARVPRTKTAETRLAREAAALAAMTAGVRARLPFAVQSRLGDAPAPPSRVVVTDFLGGTPIRVDQLLADAPLSAAVGRALAAIHALPTSLVTDAELPVVRPLDTLATAVAVMDEATATGLVPAALQNRWERATDDPALWQFTPTVVNGSLTADAVLIEGDTVTGVLGWQNLGIGDPARDLYWTLGGIATGGGDSVFDAYNQARDSTDRQVKKRATLYAELDVAKWLLHGTLTRSTEVVDDAVRMLHNLLDAVQHDLGRTIDTDTKPVMTVDEVEDMLDRSQRTS